MIKSMTAFSQESKKDGDINSEITINSYNSRYLDIVLYCPDYCRVFEEDIKKIIAQTINRGRIEIRLNIKIAQECKNHFEIDESKLLSFHTILKKIKKKSKLSSKITLEDILFQKNIIVPIIKQISSKKIMQSIKPALKKAIVMLDDMQKKKGKI